jgi:hypothetical protein
MLVVTNIVHLHLYVCPFLCIMIRIDFLLIPRALKGGRKSITPFRDWGK